MVAARQHCCTCLSGDLQPAQGEVRTADRLRIVHFDQNRQINPELTLRRALAPDSDSVVYQDRVVHVASWAARFLFNGEQLNQPVSRLSGGERARVLIAQLMLQPADVLLLDEPTNDLDIPSRSKSSKKHCSSIVAHSCWLTHDRYLLDRVSTVVLGLTAKEALPASPTTVNGKNGKVPRGKRHHSNFECQLHEISERLGTGVLPERSNSLILKQGNMPPSKNELPKRRHCCNRNGPLLKTPQSSVMPRNWLPPTLPSRRCSKRSRRSLCPMGRAGG